jgi:hypothetical protein
VQQPVVDRDFRPTRAVDIGEVPGLDIVADLANAQERADRVGDLLFAIEAHAVVARIGTHSVDVGGVCQRERDCVRKIAGAAAA